MFTAREIARILGTPEAMAAPDAVISSFLIDSRQIAGRSDVCFVALKGLRHDGHAFLSQVWQQGVRNFVVSGTSRIPDLPGSNVFVVDNTIPALQAIAAAHRRKFELQCIGITGSNGKTWVKEWLYQLMSPDQFIVKSPWSYNSQIGVPLSVLQIREQHTLGIFEAGISAPGEMQRIAEIIQPEIGILTHLGDAHQAEFSSIKTKLDEKLELFRTARVILYPGDDTLVDETVRSKYTDKELLSWGIRNPQCDLNVFEFIIDNGTTHIHFTWKGLEAKYTIPFDDQASIRNSVTCCLAMLHLDYPAETIALRMAGLQPIAMRLAIHHLEGNSVLINDAYSFDMGSLHIALEALRQHSSGMPRVVILSDIARQHAGSYQGIADLFVQYEVHHVMGIGHEVGALADMLPDKISFRQFDDVHAFVQAKPWIQFSAAAFLLKGAREYQFEQLAEHMQGRYHSATLEIDLNALLSNLQFFISQLKPETKIIAMVKAAAYGSGGAEIARFLAFHNVSMLAVAYMDEGIDLRKSGVDIPIIVMNPDPSRVAQFQQYNLEPEVYDIEFLEAIAATQKALKVHIKVDTGMHRLGFKVVDSAWLGDWLNQQSKVEVASVFSHLAAAGLPEEETFTRGQFAKYDAFYNALSEKIGYAPMRHILNTKGVLNFPEYQLDAVRLGIGLYGISGGRPVEELTPVHTLRARISQIHEISEGESVGYDRAFIANRNMRIGTVNIGYADGLRRCAGKGIYSLLIGCKSAVILGNVCMDMTMVDLSDHPDAQPGDEVIIFGPEHPITLLAEVCHTSAYEILTGISQRVPRVFLYS